MPRTKKSYVDITPDSTPAWVEKLAVKFSAGVSHVFLVTGNTGDFVDKKNHMNPFLRARFGKQVENESLYDIIVMYDRANGLTFATPTMKKRFCEAAGLFAEKPDENDPNAEAMRRALGSGKEEDEDGPPLPLDPDKAFQLVEQVMTTERIVERGSGKNKETIFLNTVFIINYPESIFPNGDWRGLQKDDRNCVVRLLSWAKNLTFQEYGNPIILVTGTASNLHDQITSSNSQIEQLEILLPSPEQRAEFIDYISKVDKIEYEPGFNADRFRDMTAGLSKVNIEDINLTAQFREIPIGPAIIKERKREIVEQEYQKILEIVDPEYGFECVGGLDWIKEFLMKRVVIPMLAGDIKRVPQGLLFLGPGGTGKTLMAYALAKMAGMNFFNLNFARLFGGIVGESERNMEKMFLSARSMIPCIGFIDEIGQSVTRGSSGDSGVSNRMFKRILEIIGDTSWRGKILWIAADNRPDQLDAALKRTGRFDVKVPFLAPFKIEERQEIFPAVMRRWNLQTKGRIDFSRLAGMTEKWVGSDIEAAIIKAYSIAGEEKRDELTQGDLVRAIDTTIVDDTDTRLWELLALKHVNDTDLLPPHLRKGFSRRKLATDIKKLQGEWLEANPPEEKEWQN